MSTGRITLEGKTALVTGGATGVGRAIVDRLAAEGANVVVLSLNAPAMSAEVKHFADDAALESLTAAATRWSGRLRIVEGDTADPAAVDRAVEAARDLGATPIDVLILNAATNTFHPIVGHPLDSWQRVLDVNATGAFLAIRACLPGMVASGWGRIVGIASTDAHTGSKNYAAYCASKHALLGLCRATAQEVEGKGIVVVTVSPGWIDTPSARMHLELQAGAAPSTNDAITTLPEPSRIAPSEVAEIVAFSISDSGRVIHGGDIRLSGGVGR